MKRGTNGYRGFAVCLIVAVLFAVWLVPACFAVDAAEASGAIDQAERDLGSAYVAVAEAEGAGAGVSTLLSELGSAADFLSEAYVAFRAGDYENARVLAVDCGNAVKGIAGDATLLKTDAERADRENFFFSVAESTVGLILLLVFGVAGWEMLKRRYLRRVLDMKPQVRETE
jgi:hypothetical protein